MKPETVALSERVCVRINELAAMVRNDTTDVVAANDHVAIIKHFAQVRSLTERIKEAREALDQMEEDLSRQKVPDTMRAHGVKTITVEGVGRVSLSNRWSCSMLDKSKGMEWLRGNGHGGLIQETVNSSALAAFAKDMSINQGTDLPSEIFKTGIMTYTSITKAD